MNPQEFMFMLLGGIWVSAWWLAAINYKLKTIKHHTETICKMAEYQNSVLTHGLNVVPQQQPRPPSTPKP